MSRDPDEWDGLIVTPSMVQARIQKRVTEESRGYRDYECAHANEDALHQAVLRAIAESRISDPQECASIALSTLDIPFGRYCA